MTILPIIFELSCSPETIKCRCGGSIRLSSVAANIFKLGWNNSRVSNLSYLSARTSAGRTLPQAHQRGVPTQAASARRLRRGRFCAAWRLTQKPPRFPSTACRCVCVEVYCVERRSNVAVPASPWDARPQSGAGALPVCRANDPR